MTRFILPTLLSMTFLSPVAAQADGTLADGSLAGPVPGLAEDDLPADVQAGIAELRKHGTRFEKAIRQIEAEARKPSWSASVDCDHQLSFEDSAPST